MFDYLEIIFVSKTMNYEINLVITPTAIMMEINFMKKAQAVAFSCRHMRDNKATWRLSSA